jgi:hypothetical protein
MQFNARRCTSDSPSVGALQTAVGPSVREDASSNSTSGPRSNILRQRARPSPSPHLSHPIEGSGGLDDAELPSPVVLGAGDIDRTTRGHRVVERYGARGPCRQRTSIRRRTARTGDRRRPPGRALIVLGGGPRLSVAQGPCARARPRRSSRRLAPRTTLRCARRPRSASDGR